MQDIAKTMPVQEGRVMPKWKLTPDVSKHSPPIIIVGAGITGLATSIALSNLSLPSIIFESRTYDDLIESGAGINLQAKAIECLNDLGISTASIIESGAVILKQSYYCPDGRHVCTLNKEGPKGGTPKQVAIHRGALMKLLLSKMNEKNGMVQLFDQVNIQGATNKDDSVVVEIMSEKENDLTNATGSSRRLINGSMLLAADGINSKLRDQMFNHKKTDPRTYHGVTHYRGVTKEFPRFLDGKTMLVIGGTGVKFVIYPISTSKQENHQTINWVFCVKEKNAHLSSSFKIEHLQKHILDTLQKNSFDVDFINLSSLVKKSESITSWPMVDLDPLDSWVQDRTVLLGDAAHAVLPVGSGGAMAGLVDAIAMKDAFAKSGPVPCTNVLQLFQKLRYGDAVKYQQKCRQQPAEKIMQEILDQGPSLVTIPSSYGERIRSQMMKMHSPTWNETTDLNSSIEKRVLVVGGGASGIVTCKEFLENGFQPVVFEAGPSIGGVFRDAYKNLELTSSSAFTAFSDFPPTEKVPTMWTSAEYLTYLHSYAVENNLFPHIQFNNKVIGVKRVARAKTTEESSALVNEETFLVKEKMEDTDWEVTVKDSITGIISSVVGKNLVLCVGSNATPNIPRFIGEETYKGMILHTSQVDTFEMFRGKRVLCLGLGESGSDVPYWIAKEPGTKVSVAYRGLGWCVPRRRPLRTGLPTDLNTNRLLWGLPRLYNRAISFLLVRTFFHDSLDSFSMLILVH